MRQRGRVVYERIVDEGEAWVDYQVMDNEDELSNCFSINQQDWQYIDLIILFVEEKRQ